MLGKSVISSGAGSASTNRVFVYEVKGFRQNDENDNNNYPFRSSNNIFLKVPYSRMNQEMKRISMMGGTIVNIMSIDEWSNNNDDVDESTETESED